MKKVGIVTFHRAENFGAALQCYALMSYFQRQNCDAYIIDYRSPIIEDGYSLLKIQGTSVCSKIKSLIWALITYHVRKAKKMKFTHFRDIYYKQTSIVRDASDMPKDFDCIFCGSDQIWNLRLTGGFDGVYFLDFDAPVKKIAYSASSEAQDWSLMLDCKEQIQRSLSSFSNISVREMDFAEFLNHTFLKECAVTCDPVFLQNREFYEKIAIAPKIKRSYVLVYNLVESANARFLAKKIAEEKHLEVINISAGVNPKRILSDDIFVFGPEEMLGYIINADYVVTTSFHGLALSLILNKQFYVVKTHHNVRLTSLLGQLELSHRCVDGDCEMENIDYSIVNALIQNMIDGSTEYIKKSLDL